MLENTEIQKLGYKIISVLKTKAVQKGIDFEFEVDRVVPKYLYVDSTRMLQILINLLSNSIKYTQKGYVKMYIELQGEVLEDVET